MPDIPYRSWGLIPVDPEPDSGELTVENPPMMSTLALDQGASLVFRLDGQVPRLQIELQTTALSTEGADADVLEVYSGAAADTYIRLRPLQTDKRYEGQYAFLSLEVERAGPWLKLHAAGLQGLVISRVQFTGDGRSL